MSAEINRKAREFHEAEARAPDLSECMKIHQQVTEHLVGKLKLHSPTLCTHVEYVGSSYEGTKIYTPSSKHEFDMMIIRRPAAGKKVTPQQTNVPGFYFLNEDGQKLNCETNYHKFIGALQKAINDMNLPGIQIQIVAHRPAVQLDVKKGGKFEYSVDMVPVYQIGNQYFVPKRSQVGDGVEVMIMESCGADEKPHLWFESHALEEKQKLVSADKGNGCRRAAYRVCKAIRDRESWWPLTSYVFKNTLLHEMDGGHQWGQELLGDRVIGILQRIISVLDSGILPAYFNREINLIANMKKDTRLNLKGHLVNLIKRPDQLFRSS